MAKTSNKNVRQKRQCKQTLTSKLYLLEQCDQIGRFFCTLGNFLKPLALINLPKSLTFLGNFCKGVKIYHFCSEIIFGQLLQTFGDFHLVTLLPSLWMIERVIEQLIDSSTVE